MIKNVFIIIFYNFYFLFTCRIGTPTIATNSSSSRLDVEIVDTNVPRTLDIGEGTSNPIYDELLPYWLGFPTLNALGKMRNGPREGIFDGNTWVSKGMSEKEALYCNLVLSLCGIKILASHT